MGKEMRERTDGRDAGLGVGANLSWREQLAVALVVVRSVHFVGEALIQLDVTGVLLDFLTT